LKRGLLLSQRFTWYVRHRSGRRDVG